jgi:putative oxidoreductase
MDKKTIASWIGRLVIGAMFLITGLGKLTGAKDAVATFTTLGVEPWARYITGVLELAAAAMVLIPQLGRHVLGAQLAAVIMLGALWARSAPITPPFPWPSWSSLPALS